jgi:hypothetical protein
MTIVVSVQSKDRSRQAWTEGPELLSRLNALQSQGLTGRALVDKLITNRWEIAPSVVTVSRTDAGARFELRIPCE